MNENRDDDCRSSEPKRTTAELTPSESSDAGLPDKEPNSLQRPKTKTKYKPGGWYHLGYLASQYLIFVAALGGGYVAYRSLGTLNRSVHVASQQAAAANRQAAAALTEAQTAKQQLEWSERPWISVKAWPISPLVFDKKGGSITIHFLLTNHGKSPAEFRIDTSMISPADPFYALKWEEKTCRGDKRAARDKRAHYNGASYPIFPDGSFTENVTFQLSQGQIQQTRAQFKKLFRLKKAPRWIQPQIVGCVVYIFGHYAYDTDFRYELSRRKPTHPNGAYAIEPKGEVPLSQLLFDRSDIGNEAH